MAKKVSPAYEMREVVYGSRRWELLGALRARGLGLMEALLASGMEGRVHGSVARGDVGPKSDVDIFMPDEAPSHMVEGAILRAGFRISRREITQATPLHTVKAVIYLDETLKLTFPLIPMRGREREFYRFGGEIGAPETKSGRRVPGIDKRLMLIIPTDYGHMERSILDDAAGAARAVGVMREVVDERIRVLRRRDEIGRTGVYYKEVLGDDDSFEGRLRDRLPRDPSLRRLVQRRRGEFKY